MYFIGQLINGLENFVADVAYNVQRDWVTSFAVALVVGVIVADVLLALS